MTMYNPPHPGGLVREALAALEINITEAAGQLGVDRVTLSRVINGHAAISVDMALKLEDWYRRLGYQGGKAEHWLKMQMAYDLWQARANRAA